jgi:hypothetical protein
MSLKNAVKTPGIHPRTVRLVAHRLNHYAIPGPNNNNNNNRYFKYIPIYIYDYFNYRLQKLPCLPLLPLYQCLFGCCDILCTVVAMVTTITIVFRVTMVALVTEFTNLLALTVATTVSKITKSRLYKGAGSALLCAHFSSSCHWWAGLNFPPLAAIYISY